MYYIPGYINIETNDNSITLENQFTMRKIELERTYWDSLRSVANLGIDELRDDLTMFLHENRFLLNDKEFCDDIHLFYRDNDNNLRLILMPTEGCNFRCIYCYESHKVKNEKLDYKAIADFLKDKINEKKWDSVIINWFGGEPLLKVDEIKYFSDLIKDIHTDISISSGIVTNAYTLDDETINILENADVMYYQITVDGEMQDKTRVLADGRPTYAVIMSNIAKLKRHNFEKCTIRVNVADNATDNHLFYNELKELIGTDQRFDLDIHKVFESDKYNHRDVSRQNDIYEQNLIAAKRAGLVVIPDEDNVVQCYGAQKNCYTFRPNGMIVKCTVALDESWNTIGSVKSGKVCLKDNNETDCLEDLRIKKCHRCVNIRKCKAMVCSRQSEAWKEKCPHYEERGEI